MRNPLVSVQAENIGVNREETTEGPPSFEQVMQEIGVTILVCLLLALAAELFTRGLPLG